MKRILVPAASLVVLLGSFSLALAQGGGGGGGSGGGGGGGGAGDANTEGVSPNGAAPGAAGPRGSQFGGGRSVSNGGENAVDVMRTQPRGSENQQR